ncbi:MAG: NADH-quinone oxidoreductase subunit M [Deltaproteobacteria bacterium]|nr:MAG: NADH-quinone oxidoreductase subunit M [Deltaproteobacteria bacterium]RLB02998.1 MAG: NADH-quinone oxidoreductase subunit M [Deltaproteobacteria bacterium]
METFLKIPLLSVVTFLPLVGALLLLFAPREREDWIKGFALGVTLLDFVLSLALFIYFDDGVAGMQFVERVPWIKQWGVSYYMGIDGISLLLILLTTYLMVLSILSSWSAIEKGIKEYMIAFLLLETGMIGTFCALDLVLFYIFWEFTLIPMYLIIGVWGGPRRVYAAVKFFLYTMAGSVLMLVAILAVYFLHAKATGHYSFDLFALYNTPMSLKAQLLLFAAFAVAFAIKVPMFPFHTWLPDAHVEAPTAGSVILAGVLLKMGTYGFIRFAIPLFPYAAHKAIPWVSVLALIGIIYGALVSMMQDDLKKLVAFSSVSHLGFVMLGMFAFTVQGVQGSIYQMLNHGVSTGALFLLVGMVYERRHTRLIADFGGLARVMPVFAVFFMIVALSSIALPGTNGFVGEFLILLGTFRSNPVYAVLGATGVIWGAAYMLWMFQRVMFGPVTKPENEGLSDLSPREVLTLVPIVIMIFWMGIFPKFFFKKMDLSVERYLRDVKGRYEMVLKAEEAKAFVARSQGARER